MRQQPPKIWKYQNPDIDTSLTFAAEFGIPPLVARLLVNRGIKTVEDARTYLYPTYADLHSPFDMADMAKAIERIRIAIKNGENIYIYGDYDADGTTATALLVNAFQHIDFPVKYYIPHRYEEGYGLNDQAIEEISEKGCKLLITVDCGITSINQVKYANELGMDVILTDHHQPPESDPPPAYAIISPKVPGNEYPYTELAGVGLAFKVAQGLIEDEAYLTSLLDLVVLGTVVDLAPLTGENRTLSKLGLDEISKQSRIGIRKLCNAAKFPNNTLDGQALSWGLGPRINAAGRMDTAKKVVELLTTDSAETAEKLAHQLDACNQERKKIEKNIQEKANEILRMDENLDEYKGLVVASSRWDPQAKGVVGIVASRLLEQYYRPIFVLVIDGDEATGSGRCIEGMNLADSLNSCSHLLMKHGGHKAAAGVTLKTENLNKFKKAFNEFACEHLVETDLIPKLALDFETNLQTLTLQTLEQFSILEPFGLKNPSPRFISKSLSIEGPPSLIGKEKIHLSMRVSDGSSKLKTIGWRKSEHFTTFSRPDISIDMAYYPQINEYNDSRTVQLILEEFRVRERSPNQTVFPPSDFPSSGRVVDSRDKDKKEYLLGLLNNNKKCIIYVHSPEKIDQLLTHVIPEHAESVGRHDHTTVLEDEIKLLEKLKGGELVAVVSSDIISESAIDTIPDLEHVIFCHLTKQSADFLSRSKPAANTQNTTLLHLLYNSKTDVQLLQDRLNETVPDRKFLTLLYQQLKQSAGTNYIGVDSLTESFTDISKQVINTGLTIFEELGFIENKTESDKHLVKILPSEKKQLNRSTTYLKCEWLQQNSQDFLKFQLQENSRQIWERIKDECGIPNTDYSET